MASEPWKLAQVGLQKEAQSEDILANKSEKQKQGQGIYRNTPF